MSYYHSKRINVNFEDAITSVIEALKIEGFGVLSQINMSEKLKEKLGIDIPRYVIIGACNPPLAYKALQADDKIGVMLPCNVIVQEKESGHIEVAAIDPIASMAATGNAALENIAAEVSGKLKRVVNSL